MLATEGEKVAPTIVGRGHVTAETVKLWNIREMARFLDFVEI